MKFMLWVEVKGTKRAFRLPKQRLRVFLLLLVHRVENHSCRSRSRQNTEW